MKLETYLDAMCRAHSERYVSRLYPRRERQYAKFRQRIMKILGDKHGASSK